MEDLKKALQFDPLLEAEKMTGKQVLRNFLNWQKPGLVVRNPATNLTEMKFMNGVVGHEKNIHRHKSDRLRQ